ncbi:ankyrin-1-like [Microplitis mediator]|uniref:ankyrin-1-like n=1 Tax=Microplitis mediator TaxID=375433 RepID=UPI00255738B8|nr:ankyrin-1-like [Microplitis mediator]
MDNKENKENKEIKVKIKIRRDISPERILKESRFSNPNESSNRVTSDFTIDHSVVEKTLEQIRWSIQEVTKLLIAASRDDFKCIQMYLVNHGIHMNTIRNRNGDTLLHVAVQNRSIKVIELLLRCNFNINILNDLYKLPLDIAIENGYLDIVRMFLSKEIDINYHLQEKQSLLYTAVEANKLEIVEIICQHGANIEYRCTFGINEGMTPFMLACKLGLIEILFFLKRNQANIHAKDANQINALYHAVEANHLTIALQLINWGADINVTNISATARGYTPLHVACRNGFTDMANLLLDRRANFNAVAQFGKTPLYLAIKYQYQCIVDTLLGHGADFEAACGTSHEYEYTPLQLACKTGNINIVTLLVNAGADINKKTESDKLTALSVAIFHNNPLIAELLLTQGAHVDKEDIIYTLTLTWRYPLLKLACTINAEALVKLLLGNVVDGNENYSELIPNKVIPIPLDNTIIFLARDPVSQKFYEPELVEEFIDIAVKKGHTSIANYLTKYSRALIVSQSYLRSILAE